MTSRKRKPDWPALMLSATARAYLDDMPLAEFQSTVVPFLETKVGTNCIRYTRESLDAWIDHGRRPGQLSTAAELARALEDDDHQDRRGQGLRQ